MEKMSGAPSLVIMLMGHTLLKVNYQTVETHLSEALLILLEDLPLHTTVHMVSSHTQCNSFNRQELGEKFSDWWIRHHGPVRWPAWSPDLTPLDFFLWGSIKFIRNHQ